MSFYMVTEDLRSVKTKKALYAAMSSMLTKHSFRKITIKGICEEAFISRAAFYAHFVDKYDLLEHWITKLRPDLPETNVTYEHMERAVNEYIHDNRFILENLVCDADNETLHILFEHILCVVGLETEKDGSGRTSPEQAVLSNFCAGGSIYYLLWQIRNKFPSDVPPMNRQLYDMLVEFKKRKSK